MANLLIIDDDADACLPLVRLLERAGHEVRCSTGPADALKHLRAGSLDLVLLDLSMPGADGFDLLEALIEEPRFAGLPVAVYSGLSDPQSVARANRLGARDYLVKGTPWEELNRRIEALLASGGAPASAPASLPLSA